MRISPRAAAVAVAAALVATGLASSPAQAAVIGCDDEHDYHVTVEVLGEEYAEVCASGGLPPAVEDIIVAVLPPPN